MNRKSADQNLQRQINNLFKKIEEDVSAVYDKITEDLTEDITDISTLKETGNQIQQNKSDIASILAYLNALRGSVQTLYAGYSDNSASTKKIYCHPIRIRSSVSPNKPNIRLTCLIFNDSPTEFTLQSFKVFADNLSNNTSGTGAIMMSGGYQKSDYTIIVSYFIKSYSDGNYYIVGLKPDGDADTVSSLDFYDIFDSQTVILQDGVNAIN